jgi:acyl-CoA synthetase (AMP-forming)/AMP-acid ligase II
LTARTVADLNAMGIGRGDRVAIVLPNGPEMASAFVAIAGAAATAPLNPTYRREDFDFSLEDLRAKALVVLAGAATPARDAAVAAGLNVIELVPGETAGDFTFQSPLSGMPALSGPAEPDDIALLLHTSGTTSRPKLVPLRHINVSTSANNISAALGL